MKGRLGSHYITAIDIGTTKICVLIAQQIGDAHLEIVGIGRAPSLGLARGVVVDIAPAVHSIKAALKEAELMAGVSVESAYIGISGGHISACNSQGIVPIKHGEVRELDINAVLSAAKAIPLPEGQQLLHALPQFFTIDRSHVVRDPLGMYGVRLEAQVHLITGAVASVQNLIRCCALAGVKAQDIILEPLASADAVLSGDERELGIGLLDIGGGTSDFAIYQQGNIRHTQVFLIAGNVFTNDLAICLRTTIKDAERIKKEHGTADASLMQHNIPLQVDTVHGQEQQTVMSRDVSAVLTSRAQELFECMKESIGTQNLRPLMHAGLVLTGGGALLHGLKDQAESILNIPVRIGRPRVPANFQQALDDPSYATGYGLLIQAMRRSKSGMTGLTGTFVTQVFSRMRSWVFDFF